MEKEPLDVIITDFIAYWSASAVMTIMVMLTKKTWAGGAKVIFIFIWWLLCWYLFSWIPAYFLPNYYAGEMRTAMNWITTILSFMFLLIAFEKDTFYEIFNYIKNKKKKEYFNNNSK